MKLTTCCCHLLCWLSVIAAAGVALLFWAYGVQSEGELTLPNAPGKAVIVREQDSGIAHIRGDDWNSVVYAQGFAHAQTRLWQMERTRRVIRGEISELFGKETF